MPQKVAVRREIAHTSGTRHRWLATSYTAQRRRGRSRHPRLPTVATSHFLYSIVRARTTPWSCVYVRNRYHHQGHIVVTRKMAGVGKRTYLREVNPYLICPLCRGYLIDATTVVECLHSFCRSCILKHLSTEAHCPSCKHVLNKAKPNIKADKALQDIVYKLVPGLYHKEMRKRREFYKKHPEYADFATPEQRGEDVSGRLIFAPEDAVSLSLEYLPPGADPLSILLSTNDDSSHSNATNGHNYNNNNHNGNIASNRRYLQCPALVTIAHLKKFLALKYSVDMTRYTIEICHRRAPLPEHWTLMDVAYIYAWKRNAPMRFFYRVAQEEQRLEAPPHERPSTPGLGASLPPIDANTSSRNDTKIETLDNNEQSKSVVECTNNRDEVPTLEDQSEVSKEESGSMSDEKCRTSKVEETESGKVDVPSTTTMSTATTISSATAVSSTTTSVPIEIATSTVSTTTLTTTALSNTVTTSTTSNASNKQIKTPIKILKNPDGRYEVLRSPSIAWNMKEQNSPGAEAKPSSPEFSVVSIGNGQNSNSVKITLKQCTPTNTNSKKPKVISNVLLHCGQVEKDSTGALVLQQLQRDRDKQQAADRQEKQKRRVTFMERSTPDRNVNIVQKTTIKKPGEQQDKKQFLQGFQLTARESGSENIVSNTSFKPEIRSAHPANEIVDSKNSIPSKKIQVNNKAEIVASVEEAKKKNNGENPIINTSESVTSANKRTPTVAGIGNSNICKGSLGKQCNDIESRGCNYSKNTSAAINVTTSNNHLSKMDVYTFSNDPPIVPAGAVKRKCPPGLPIFDIKRKRQQGQNQPPKKQVPLLQSNVKSARKPTTEHVVTIKRPTTLGEAGPSRPTSSNNAQAIIPKPQTSPMLSNDTRNILDGCGLNIPASLSITLTAPKSPSANVGFVEINEQKDNRKGMLGKVSPSITLNDRSVDPRVLKALKAGQIRMPAPPKPKQAKQLDCETIHQRQVPPGKRKREQDSRDILDLSGGKKMDIHPLRIPQPVSKLKAKPMSRDSVPSISDQGQVVTLMGGHRYYRAPPGSLTPAAHRVNDCPIPTPSRTPVYAPGLSSSLSNSRSNNSLSSVFPSLQSLYALSQAPNLQQFQMDARLRLPRPEVNTSTIGNVDNRSTTSGQPGKSHLAAQCAPVKPARSSVAPLAVPIAKQPSSERSISTHLSTMSGNEASKTAVFRANETFESTDVCQPPSVQANHSPRSGNNNSSSSNNSEEQVTSELAREPNPGPTEDARKEPDNTSRQQQHHEAASPRVSSTASPSPPPGDVNTSSNNENTSSQEDNNVANTTNTTDNDIPATSSASKNDVAAEVSSNKSPASPDSSSITVDSSANKNCSTVDQELPSPTQTSESVKSSDSSAKPDTGTTDVTIIGSEKDKGQFDQPDSKQLTSEMFQKRLMAAFPSKEWANNPIAAEHLGNFLKSLNASIKTEVNAEKFEAEKLESQAVCGDTTRINNGVSPKSRTDVIERS